MDKLCIENSIKLIGKCLLYVWKIEDIGGEREDFPHVNPRSLL